MILERDARTRAKVEGLACHAEESNDKSLNRNKWGQRGVTSRLPFWKDSPHKDVEFGCPGARLEAGTAAGEPQEHSAHVLMVAQAKH